jgi:lipopolysaccharide export system protein LptC
VKPVRGFGRAWDRATIYLPVILMGVLALGTYWLARTTPAFSSAPSARQPEKHEADYFLRGFSVKSFDPGGRLKSEIQGVEARHFPDTDTMEVDQPRLRSFTAKGVVIATAKKGISNGDGSQVQLIGNAVVVREAKDEQGQPLPPLEVRGEFLHVYVDPERVKSHLPVTITRGADVFNADSMDYDNLARVMDLSGRVRGVLQPRQVATAPPP